MISICYFLLKNLRLPDRKVLTKANPENSKHFSSFKFNALFIFSSFYPIISEIFLWQLWRKFRLFSLIWCNIRYYCLKKFNAVSLINIRYGLFLSISGDRQSLKRSSIYIFLIHWSRIKRKFCPCKSHSSDSMHLFLSPWWLQFLKYINETFLGKTVLSYFYHNHNFFVNANSDTFDSFIKNKVGYDWGRAGGLKIIGISCWKTMKL